MGRPFILCAAHPDDETLGAGVAIAEHIAAGRDVHILLMTRGTNSGVIRQLNGTNTGSWWGVTHDPVAEGYQPLGVDEFGAARYRELVAAMGCLGVTADRIHEASDLIGEPVLDSYVTVDQAKRAIAALADTFDPAAGNVGLWTPSWLVDDNPDHRAIGDASRQLGTEDPVRWADRRFYVLPAYWTDPRLSQIAGEFWDLPTDSTIQVKARNATRAYRSWAPVQGLYAIGYHSTAGMFGQIDGTTGTPKCLIHK